MEFALFILVTAILFIRPGDYVPGMQGIPLYLMAIVPCILLSWNKLAPQLSARGLRERPVFVFGLGLVVLAFFSSALEGRFAMGIGFATELLKILIFCLLMTAHLDSSARLKRFLGCLVVIIAVPVFLATIHYNGIVEIPAFKVTLDSPSEGGGEGPNTRRLGATGNFADPNDVCEIVNCAMIFSLYGLLNQRYAMARVPWLAPIALFGYALSLTRSRGGFLAAMVGLMMLFWSRFGTKKAVILAVLGVPLILVAFAGRQTSLSLNEGTGQGRIQLWEDAMEGLKQSPVIGIGIGEFSRRGGFVAHNAFIQTFTELGILGGTLLFGQYFYCVMNLLNLGWRRATVSDPEMRRVQPFVLAAMASFATSEMSLTNPFSLVSYVMFGLSTACVRVADPWPPLPDLELNGRFVRRVVLFSGLFLLSLFVFIKVMVRH